MGSKHASVHLRCDDSTQVLAKLKEKFHKKKEPQEDMDGDDPAVIVVGEHFVSVYWYDHIRVENLRKEMMKYAHLCGVPALGVGIYDDTNFSIYAVCNAGKPEARSCRGEYLFDYEDITPVEAEDICDIIDAPFYVEGLQKVLAADDGEEMADTFELETGLPIYMDDDLCEEDGMKKLHEWENATVFLVEK